ncbi:hypothetical protein IM687_13825 [Stutzerimonas stutzeri]|uniref:phage tail terminator-like protein n=1 Tax=Stutzerimonas stutzeri TaxID=316 RepID=UPI0018AB179F|nr:phage tail terminator-like protein [Stutzerimonas stutzeri]QPI08274.1 hypothetical protein IM687_13825 [Stutzerimonas stutzeri]
MSETKINGALVSAYLASGVMPQARTAFEGVSFTPPQGQSWARLTNMPTDRDKPGLAPSDSSQVTGILQVDLYWPKGSGTGPIIAAANQLLGYFEPHSSVEYQGQRVKIRRVRRSQIRPGDVWQSVQVDIYYRATVVR